jgi:hypothetical protein
MTMQDNENAATATFSRTAWNKGKLVGAKPPLRPKHVWSIRTKLQIADRKRDLAMFNLAIDSKLRGCDVVHHIKTRLSHCEKDWETFASQERHAAPTAIGCRLTAERDGRCGGGSS